MPYGCFVTCFVESCPGQVVENSIKNHTAVQTVSQMISQNLKKLTDQHQTKSDPKINAKKAFISFVHKWKKILIHVNQNISFYTTCTF